MINTKILMTASALATGLAGLLATFLPQETLALLGAAPSATGSLLIQLLGALYFGFAMLNWMSKGSLIGGIYGRPLLVANLAHFMIAGLALGKFVARGRAGGALLTVFVVYAIFALWFGALLFASPVRPRADIER